MEENTPIVDETKTTNGDIMRAFGQLEGKIDGMMRLYSETVNRLVSLDTKTDTRFEGVHKRLGVVEKRLFALWLIFGGVWALILAGAGAVISLFRGN